VALLNSLPISSRALLRRLLVYLRKVVDHSQENRMDLHNLATTMAPVLMQEKPALAQTGFSCCSAIPTRPRHQRHASDTAVSPAKMAEEAVRAVAIIRTLLSTPNEQLFPENAHTLSVSRVTSDIQATGTNHESVSLAAGDLVFVFLKLEDVWWIEHKHSHHLCRLPVSEATSSLETAIEKLALSNIKSEDIEAVLDEEDKVEVEPAGDGEKKKINSSEDISTRLVAKAAADGTAIQTLGSANSYSTRKSAFSYDLSSSYGALHSSKAALTSHFGRLTSRKSPQDKEEKKEKKERKKKEKKEEKKEEKKKEEKKKEEKKKEEKKEEKKKEEEKEEKKKEEKKEEKKKEEEKGDHEKTFSNPLLGKIPKQVVRNDRSFCME